MTALLSAAVLLVYAPTPPKKVRVRFGHEIEPSKSVRRLAAVLLDVAVVRPLIRLDVRTAPFNHLAQPYA
jgi:hypothetical protein